MNEDKLYDISEVCNLLDVTSRTLRFYEEKGIIKSTTIGVSSRRKYSEEQLTNIKNVIILRTLGLSVKSIIELQSNKTTLKDAVTLRRAEIYANIDSRIREINILNDALIAIDAGEKIFYNKENYSSNLNTDAINISKKCAEAIINGNDNLLYSYFSSELLISMPLNTYLNARNDTLTPIGQFVSFDKYVVDIRNPNIIYHFIKFSKLGLKITFVFNDLKIEGLWLGYYNTNKK